MNVKQNISSNICSRISVWGGPIEPLFVKYKCDAKKEKEILSYFIVCGVSSG